MNACWIIIYLLEIFDEIFFLVRNSHFVVKFPNVFLSWNQQHIDSIYGTQGGLHFAVLESDTNKNGTQFSQLRPEHLKQNKYWRCTFTHLQDFSAVQGSVVRGPSVSLLEIRKSAAPMYDFFLYQTQAILYAFICFVFSNCSSGGLKSSTCTWSRSVRRRGHNLDLVVAHGDGLSDLEVFNTIDDCWTSLATLPEHCGLDGVAIIGFRSKVRK